MLAVPGARANAPEASVLSYRMTKLDLPLVTPFGKEGAARDAPYDAGYGVRFDGTSSGWAVFGSAAAGALFTLAVINAFVPRWLPNGAARSLNLNGTGGHSPSDVGVDDYGMGYSAH